MVKRTYISNIEAEFFNEHKLMSGDKPPITGDYTIGDIVISNIQENGVIGWVCIEAGNPGKWIDINGLSELENIIDDLLEEDMLINETIDDIVNVLEEIQKDIDNIEENEIKNIKKQLNTLEVEFNNIDHSIYATNEELEKTNNDVKNNVNEINTIKINVASNTNSINDLKIDNNNIKLDIEKINKEMDIIEELAGGIDLSGFATNDMVNDIITQVDTNTNDISTLKNSVNTNANNISANNTLINNVTKTVDSNTTQISENTDNISQLITKVDNNIKDINEHTSTINNLVVRVNDIEETAGGDVNLDDYVTVESFEELDGRVTQLEESAGGDVNLDDYVTVESFEELDGRVTKLEETIESITDHEHDDYVTVESFEELDGRVVTNTENIEYYGGIIDTLGKEIASLETELTGKIDTNADDISSLTTRVNVNTANIVRLDTNVGVLEGSMTYLTTKVNNLENDIKNGLVSALAEHGANSDMSWEELFGLLVNNSSDSNNDSGDSADNLLLYDAGVENSTTSFNRLCITEACKGEDKMVFSLNNSAYHFACISYAGYVNFDLYDEVKITLYTQTTDQQPILYAYKIDDVSGIYGIGSTNAFTTQSTQAVYNATTVMTNITPTEYTFSLSDLRQTSTGSYGYLGIAIEIGDYGEGEVYITKIEVTPIEVAPEE